MAILLHIKRLKTHRTKKKGSKKDMGPTKEETQTLANRLLKRWDISKNTLAKLCDVMPATVARWCSGGAEMSEPLYVLLYEFSGVFSNECPKNLHDGLRRIINHPNGSRPVITHIGNDVSRHATVHTQEEFNEAVSRGRPKPKVLTKKYLEAMGVTHQVLKIIRGDDPCIEEDVGVKQKDGTFKVIFSPIDASDCIVFTSEDIDRWSAEKTWDKRLVEWGRLYPQSLSPLQAKSKGKRQGARSNELGAYDFEAP